MDSASADEGDNTAEDSAAAAFAELDKVVSGDLGEPSDDESGEGEEEEEEEEEEELGATNSKGTGSRKKRHWQHAFHRRSLKKTVIELRAKDPGLVAEFRTVVWARLSGYPRLSQGHSIISLNFCELRIGQNRWWPCLIYDPLGLQSPKFQKLAKKGLSAKKTKQHMVRWFDGKGQFSLMPRTKLKPFQGDYTEAYRAGDNGGKKISAKRLSELAVAVEEADKCLQNPEFYCPEVVEEPEPVKPAKKRGTHRGHKNDMSTAMAGGTAKRKKKSASTGATIKAAVPREPKGKEKKARKKKAKELQRQASEASAASAASEVTVEGDEDPMGEDIPEPAEDATDENYVPGQPNKLLKSRKRKHPPSDKPMVVPAKKKVKKKKGIKAPAVDAGETTLDRTVRLGKLLMQWVDTGNVGKALKVCGKLMKVKVNAAMLAESKVIPMVQSVKSSAKDLDVKNAAKGVLKTWKALCKQEAAAKQLARVDSIPKSAEEALKVEPTSAAAGIKKTADTPST